MIFFFPLFEKKLDFPLKKNDKRLMIRDFHFWCFQVYSNSKRGLDIEDGIGRSHKHARHQDMDQYSGAEDDMSD